MHPPRKLVAEEQLYAAALRALMRRAHSVYEMRQLLERRAAQAFMARRVLERLKQEKLLDDARYARQFARHHAESRRQGRFRIARELRARGVPDRHIEAALEETFQEVDEAALVRQQLQRRLRQMRGRKAGERRPDQRKLASLYRSLLRAGFAGDLIRQELRSLTQQDLPELAETPQGEDE